MGSLKQLIHPRAVIQKKYNNHPIDEEIVRSLLTFSFFFTITIGAIALGLALIGLDLDHRPDRRGHRRVQRGPGAGHDHRASRQLLDLAGCGEVAADHW